MLKKFKNISVLDPILFCLSTPIPLLIFTKEYIEFYNEVTQKMDSTPQKTSEGTGALEVLKKRYVNGEITKEEFEEMKEVILAK